MAKLGKDANVISHWHHPIENFQTSTMEFYAAVEVALQPRQIPDYTVSRIDWHEGGVLTARREYLRIKRGKLAFDLCAAPFGTGFFFSWWLAELPPSHALLWALLLCFLGFWFIGALVTAFGFTGLFWGIVLGLCGMFLLGYLPKEGKLGTDAEDVVVSIPFFGSLYEKIFKPSTYYQTDTTLMFQSVVHAAVLEVVDQLMSANGVRALTELERKPIMREFYQR
ncbi:MAG: hypothetical protein ACYCO5_00340 [Acidobacteriaceae bacterium]